MFRSCLLILTFLMTNSLVLPAQRAGGGSVSGGSHMGGNRMGGYQITAGPGTNLGFFGLNSRFNRGRGFGDFGFWGPWYYPDLAWGLFSGDYVWDLHDYPYQQPVTATSPQVVVVENKDPRPLAAPAEPPKLIEVPQSKDASQSAKAISGDKLPPTMFVLKSGERLESRHYLLTAQSLQIEVDREQRLIPVNTINVDATIAANQQRGIELTIPQDRNTVFLSF